jgi:threonine/homoserine/homoserine lactone efflux protein
MAANVLERTGHAPVPLARSPRASGVIIVFLAGLVLAFLGSIAPTGPIGVLLLERSLRRRHAAAAAVGLGGAVAETTYAAVAAFGVGGLLQRLPLGEVAARVVALVVVLFLGVRFLVFAPGAGGERAVHRADPGGWRRALVVGFLVSAANPVLVLSWSASVAMLGPGLSVQLDTGLRLAFVAGVAAGLVSGVVTTVSLLRRFDHRFTLRASTLVIRAAGAMLLVLGVAAGAALALRELA